MKTLLQNLYWGNIEPYEQFQIKTEEQIALQKKQFAEYDAFEKKLSEIDNELLISFRKIHEQLFLDLPYEHESVFVCGFRLGARIMMEVMEII